VTPSEPTWSPFAAEGLKRHVYVLGHNDQPAVILMHELPGLTPQCLDLASRLHARGFTVYMPLLLGALGERAMVANTLRLCVAWEFNQFCLRGGLPVTRWLRALSTKVYQEHKNTSIGVIGMCLTGGFVLSLAADKHVIAGVSAQPSYPIEWSHRHRKAMGATCGEMRSAARNARLRMLGLRFENDGLSPPDRFSLLERLLADRFEVIELPSNTANIERSAHAVLTDEYRPWPEHPTNEAFEDVAQFFREQLYCDAVQPRRRRRRPATA
jgi:dienelactone hydrolase